MPSMFQNTVSSGADSSYGVPSSAMNSNWSAFGKGDSVWKARLRPYQKLGNGSQINAAGSVDHSMWGAGGFSRFLPGRGVMEATPIGPNDPLYSKYMAANGGGGGSGAGGFGQNVGSTITPEGIFNNTHTQHAINQAAAKAFASSNPDYAMKRFTRPGFSRDAGTLSLAVPQIAAGSTAARQAQASIPMSDFFQNMGHLLEGEVAQGNEALGLAEVLRRNQNTQRSSQLSALNTILSILG